MRLFELHRIEDESGVSGTGIIAQGVEFDDRTCAMRWMTDTRSTAFYNNIRELETIHGHGGKTKIVHVGSPFERGMEHCAMDACENAPFGSVGGEENRGSLMAPDYITPWERARYMAGYTTQAELMYGKDWKTCKFGWSPALTIGGKE